MRCPLLLIAVLLVSSARAQSFEIGFVGSFIPKVTHAQGTSSPDASNDLKLFGMALHAEGPFSLVTGLQVLYGQSRLLDWQALDGIQGLTHDISTLTVELPLLYQHPLSRSLTLRGGASAGWTRLNRVAGITAVVHEVGGGTSLVVVEIEDRQDAVVGGARLSLLAEPVEDVRLELGSIFRLATVRIPEEPMVIETHPESGSFTIVERGHPRSTYEMGGVHGILGVYYRF